MCVYNSQRAEVNTTISWCGSTSNEPTVSQLASDEDSYEVKYSDTDLMEITVNFCNQVRDCCKTTTFHYPGIIFKPAILVV